MFAYEIIEKAYLDNHKLLITGNGGTVADSEHILGELMNRFKVPRLVSYEFAKGLKSIDVECGEGLLKNLERCLMALTWLSTKHSQWLISMMLME